MGKERKIRKIECNKCEKMIAAYLSNDLSIFDIDVMLNHVKSCSSCMEELTIQYLVTEGFSEVDKTGNYNLIKSLEDKIASSQNRVEKHMLHTSTSILFLSVVFLLSVLAIIVLVF